ncbi:MAG TPA: hypothetical protein VGN39_13220 [Terriglobales bacterium]|nr:hypothetical protein [Terriglobales bacterium]
MAPNRDFVPCPKCGEQIPFRWGELKRNANLVISCSACGLNDLASNIVSMAVYKRMKELGHAMPKPPAPQPIDPIRVLHSENGYESVVRRYKNGNQRVYTRHAKGKSPD